MKSKPMLYIILIILLLLTVSCSRLIEIYKPVKTEKINWQSIYDLKQLNKDYVAQGIEVYKDYLLFTVHVKDKGSVLIVFKIKNDNKIDYKFSVNFPKKATHVSDLSIYKNNLYAIDYASNNLYEIDISKSIDQKKMIINKTIPTNLSRSGSVIVTNYENKTVVYITQFIISPYIKLFFLNDLPNKNKKVIMKIKAKYFIQGLYKKDDKFLVSSNKNGNDIIFITNESDLKNSKNVMNKSTRVLNAPGKMVEDIVLYKNFIITSDEETNEIYITTKKVF